MSKACVFTFLYNEPVMFKIWLSYYSKYFSVGDIYVLHAIKEKRCEFDYWLAEQSGFTRIEIPDGPKYDFGSIANTVKSYQRSFLKDNEFVLYCDVDEIVCSPMGLGHYVSQCKKEFVHCSGYEIVHKYKNNEESEFDLSKPVFSQRSWWYPSKMYSKPLLSKIPLDYCHGFHFAWDKQPQPPPDPNLLCIHLHKLDFNVALHRNMSRVVTEEEYQTWCVPPPGHQNTLSEAGLHNFWFNSIDDGKPVVHELIPDHIKNNIPL